MNKPEDTMLSKINKTQKDKYHLYKVPGTGKFRDRKNRGYWGFGKERIESYYLMGTEFLFEIIIYSGNGE